MIHPCAHTHPPTHLHTCYMSCIEIIIFMISLIFPDYGCNTFFYHFKLLFKNGMQSLHGDEPFYFIFITVSNDICSDSEKL